MPGTGASLVAQWIRIYLPMHGTRSQSLIGKDPTCTGATKPIFHNCGEGNSSPLQYSCLENPVDGGTWWAGVHRVAESWILLKRLSVHACIGGGNGNPLQCSCLENPRDREAWWAAVYRVAQSRTRLKRLSSSSHNHIP